MRRLLTSDLTRNLLVGFMLGTAGLLMVQPASALPW